MAWVMRRARSGLLMTKSMSASSHSRRGRGLHGHNHAIVSLQYFLDMPEREAGRRRNILDEMSVGEGDTLSAHVRGCSGKMSDLGYSRGVLGKTRSDE